MNGQDENKLMRRVAGHHNYRLDGIGDLLTRAREASVMDIGCNRGQVAYDFFLNGATRVHGCDIYEQGIQAAREWYKDLRSCEAQFEVVDLSKGAVSLKPFSNSRYDVILMLATYHKLKRIMPSPLLTELVVELGNRTIKYFAWRGTSEKTNENEGELLNLDRDLKEAGLKRIHTSYISLQLGVAAIWSRP